MPNRGGTIYAIRALGTPLVKIGCTKGPVEQRLKQLQTGNAHLLSLEASIAVDTHVYFIERYIQKFLAQEHDHGEWFRTSLNREQLKELLMRAMQYVEDQKRNYNQNHAHHEEIHEEIHDQTSELRCLLQKDVKNVCQLISRIEEILTNKLQDLRKQISEFETLRSEFQDLARRVQRVTSYMERNPYWPSQEEEVKKALSCHHGMVETLMSEELPPCPSPSPVSTSGA